MKIAIVLTYIATLAMANPVSTGNELEQRCRLTKQKRKFVGVRSRDPLHTLTAFHAQIFPV
jgi:hypothetical protein